MATWHQQGTRAPGRGPCRKEVAPSTQLRTWYGHDPERFEEFDRRYRAELAEGEPAAALAGLKALARNGTVTLLTATKEVDISQAAVLVKVLSGRHK